MLSSERQHARTYRWRGRTGDYLFRRIQKFGWGWTRPEPEAAFVILLRVWASRARLFFASAPRNSRGHGGGTTVHSACPTEIFDEPHSKPKSVHGRARARAHTLASNGIALRPRQGQNAQTDGTRVQFARNFLFVRPASQITRCIGRPLLGSFARPTGRSNARGHTFPYDNGATGGQTDGWTGGGREKERGEEGRADNRWQITADGKPK